jgi:hypothetical protein
MYVNRLRPDLDARIATNDHTMESYESAEERDAPATIPGVPTMMVNQSHYLRE